MITFSVCAGPGLRQEGGLGAERLGFHTFLSLPCKHVVDSQIQTCLSTSGHICTQ